MISAEEIYRKTGVKVAVSDVMQKKIADWIGMFSNSGESLNTASAICTEFSRLIFAETKIRVAGKSDASNAFQKIIDAALPVVTQKCDIANASGCMAFKPFFSDGYVYIDCIPAANIFPVRVSASGSISEIVFVDTSADNGNYYTRLEHHEFFGDKNMTSIRNYTFISANSDELGKPCDIDSTPWAGSVSDADVMTDIPLFGFYRVPKTNNIEYGSPMGVSVFSDAVQLIAEAEDLWQTMRWEFKGSELAVFSDQTLFTKRHTLPEKMKRLFTLLRKETEKPILETFSPKIRVAEYLEGLQAIFRRVEFASMLSYGTISDPAVVDRTATEVKTSKQRSLIFISSMQQALEKALKDACHACGILMQYHGLKGAEYADDISFEWGDSVKEDYDIEFNRLLTMTQNGYLDPKQLIMWYYGVDEEDAVKMMPQQKTAEYSPFFEK